MDAPRLAMIPSQRQPKELVPRRDNRIRCWRISGPGRLQSVKQALPTLTGISQNFHNHL